MLERLLKIVSEQEGDTEEVGFTDYVDTTFSDFGDVTTDLDDEKGTGTFAVEGDGWRAEVTIDSPTTGKLLIVDTDSEDEIDGEEFKNDDLGALLDAIYTYIDDGLEGEEGEEGEEEESQKEGKVA